jgi:Zn finger protein HypA/HybF involved in hydrogenase expression
MEIRYCGDCGESWHDAGDFCCPFCGSENTFIDDGGQDEHSDEQSH